MFGLFEWIFSVENFWFKFYFFMAFMFMGYFFVRLIIYALQEIGSMFWKILWGAFLVPVILGLLWPLSLINKIVMKRWIASWMNNIHWWES